MSATTVRDRVGVSAEQQHVAVMETDEAAADARSQRQLACNTARAHALGVARSPDAFIAWVRAHPCPDGADIGDGYWNVAH